MPECVTCYEHVVALQPASPEALANLASAYKDSGGRGGAGRGGAGRAGRGEAG